MCSAKGQSLQLVRPSDTKKAAEKIIISCMLVRSRKTCQ